MITIITTVISTLVAIVIAIINLRQINKSVRNSNRPYVVMYSKILQIGSSSQHYLVIKNFGKSGAVIDSISFSNTNFHKSSYTPFESMRNCFIAPNQTFTCWIKYAKDPYIPFDVIISYHDNIEPFKEIITINPEAISKQVVVHSKSGTQSDLEKTISHLYEETLRNNL